MKLTWVIQICKNVFAVNNGIVLTFHAQDLTKGYGRGMHRPRSDWQVRDDFSNELGRQMRGDFSIRPAVERWFFPMGRAWKIGPCRPLIWVCCKKKKYFLPSLNLLKHQKAMLPRYILIWNMHNLYFLQILLMITVIWAERRGRRST